MHTFLGACMAQLAKGPQTSDPVHQNKQKPQGDKFHWHTQVNFVTKEKKRFSKIIQGLSQKNPVSVLAALMEEKCFHARQQQPNAAKLFHVSAR